MVMTPGERKVRLLGGEVGGKTKLLGDGCAKAGHVAVPIWHYSANLGCFDEAYISCFSTIFAVL